MTMGKKTQDENIIHSGGSFHTHSPTHTWQFAVDRDEEMTYLPVCVCVCVDDAVCRGVCADSLWIDWRPLSCPTEATAGPWSPHEHSESRVQPAAARLSVF